MSFLYITEFSDVAIVGHGVPAIPMTPPVAEQKIAISGTSLASATFNANTRFVVLQSDVICSIAWGTSASPPTAAITNKRVSPGVDLGFGVQGGLGQVAVISNT